MLDDTEGARLEPIVSVRRAVPQLRRIDAWCAALLAAVPFLMLAPILGVLSGPQPEYGVKRA